MRFKDFNIIFIVGIGLGIGIKAEAFYPDIEPSLAFLGEKFMHRDINLVAKNPNADKCTKDHSGIVITQGPVDTVWVRQYWGPAHSADYPWRRGITVDNLGNVYCIGRSKGSGTDEDWVTIKYDANGNELWVKRYDDNYGFDIARGLAVDDSGYVYVTGTSGATLSSWLTTIKYNQNGDTVWIKKYQGTGGFVNGAWALVLDDSGNVYVTGYETGPNIDINSVTIKYDRNGNRKWLAIYDVPGTDLDYEEAHDLAMDAEGNIYVVGLFDPDGGGLSDYLVVKYNQAGETLWVRTWDSGYNDFDEATSVVTDGAGNVYVGGSAYYCYGVIKYDSSGNFLWASAPFYRGNWITRLCIDGNGDIWDTGYSNAYTEKLNHLTGEKIWSWWGEGSWGNYGQMWDMKIDSENNVYITGCDSNVDYCTIKFNNSGEELWRVFYRVPIGANISYGIAIDSAGYVYVTGHVYLDPHGNGPIVTIKYRQMPVNIAEQKSRLLVGNGLRVNNPVKDNIFLYLPDKYTGYSVSVSLYDATGRLVKRIEKITSGGNTQIILPVKELNQGVYFLKVSGGAVENQTFKLVKIE